MVFEHALVLVSELALKVGFERAEIPSLRDAPKIPSGTELWKSSYALMIVVPLESSNVEDTAGVAQIAQEWLDLACMAEEQRHRPVVDGYILFLLASAPSKELEARIRELELDPTACRKHFAWPYAAEDPDLVWGRIYRVTPLGIPTSPVSEGMTGAPLLHVDAQRFLLEDIKNLKGRAAARSHANKPSGAE